MRGLLPIAAALTVAAGFAQDIVQLTPERVKVLFENDRVRVLRFNEPGHSKLPMHSHSAFVSVAFTAEHGKFTFPNGDTREERTKAGAVTYNDGITHAYENLAGTEAESVMVELKGEPGGAAAMGNAVDCVKVDPKHYKVELENDRVRILRIRYGPKEKSVMHDHPASVLVQLTDLKARFTLPDGKTEEHSGMARDIRWNDGGRHLPENIDGKPMQALLIELKK